MKWRRQRATQRAKLRTETIIHHVPDEDRRCPRCGGDRFAPVRRQRPAPRRARLEG